MTDFNLTNHGSIVTIRPMNEEAQTWWDDNVDPDAQMFGGAYVVEPRYVEQIVTGMTGEGLTIQ